MSKSSRTAARNRLREERARQARRARQIRQLTISLAGVAVVAIVVTIGLVVASRDTEKSEYTGSLPPVSKESDGSVVLAAAGVTGPVLDVFEDFQCPICKEFEERSGGAIQRLAAEGRVKVVYHPFVVFAQEPMRSNSLRAATAARCAPEDRWVDYHDRLYAAQPPEQRSGGFSVEQLVELGEQAGIGSRAFASCVREQREAPGVVRQSQRIIGRENVPGTPTLRLNGRTLESDVALAPERLREEIGKADSSS